MNRINIVECLPFPPWINPHTGHIYFTFLKRFIIAVVVVVFIIIIIIIIIVVIIIRQKKSPSCRIQEMTQTLYPPTKLVKVL